MAARGWLQGDVLVLIGVFVIAVLALASTLSWDNESTPRAFVTGNFVYDVEGAQSGAAMIPGAFCCSKLLVQQKGGCPADAVAAVPQCVPATTDGCGSWVRC